MSNLKTTKMSKKVPDEERVRKAYSPRGERGQKMTNFRCDLDNWDKLNKQPNKGRYINEAIRAYNK